MIRLIKFHLIIIILKVVFDQNSGLIILQGHKELSWTDPQCNLYT